MLEWYFGSCPAKIIVRGSYLDSIGFNISNGLHFAIGNYYFWLTLKQNIDGRSGKTTYVNCSISKLPLLLYSEERLANLTAYIFRECSADKAEKSAEF